MEPWELPDERRAETASQGGGPGGAGRRVFSANLEGGPTELANYDINADVGPMAAAVKEFAQHERTDAPRITRSDQLFVSQRHQRIGALKSPQRFDIALDEAAAPRLRDQMQDGLGVGGRLH